MPDLQSIYDDAMGDFSMTEYDSAIAKLESILELEPQHFEAQLALGMAYYRKGDFARAIAEGHKAEKLRPTEQLVHTNLSLFYMKSGDKKTAEHHGLQARISSWRGNMAAPGNPGQATTADDPELRMAAPKPAPMKMPEKFPDQPWKKKTPIHGGADQKKDPTPSDESKAK
jgi:tetratricopeptide (TPR) repeat protein